jgi:hypothetical protein
MADSTTILDTISSTQAYQEVTANEMFDALSPASAFGRRASTCSGLTWGHYGVPRWYINGTATIKANGTVALTASSTRYVSVSRALAVAEAGTAFAADKLAMYKIVTGTATVTSYEDHRDPRHEVRFLYSRVTVDMGDANQPLTYIQAMADSIEATGALLAKRDLIVPLVPRDWKIYANTSGGYGIRVIAASGTGIDVADGKRAILECDGTNVVRITADT